MSEEKKTVKTIKVKRHLWPEEVQAKKDKRTKTLLKIGIVVMTIAGILIGWTGGSILPFSGLSRLRQAYSGLDSSDKISSVLEIMENEWYFGDSIEDLAERLTNQALIGITTNSEDLHTEYMSAEETETFTQSINRDYVGIGVQFIHNGGVNIIERVFKDSPAEAAGLQPGDVFYAIDGTSVDGLSTDEIKELVLGDEGTDVVIEVVRDGEVVSLTVTRAPVSATAYAYLIDDQTIYLELLQFGQGSADEILKYIEPLLADGEKDLILDLRGNGGGYLTALAQIASMFLPDDTLCMLQEYSDGSVTEIRTSGEPVENVGDIVILVDGSTASAAEVLTLALKEQREGTTVIGTTTYGKGTVQVTKSFTDNSSLKYTTSRWLSPSGVWINGTGIEPDEEVFLHDALYHSFAGMDEESVYQYDDVSSAVQDVQLILDYLDYEVDRTDGYFSAGTEEALKEFEEDHDMTADGTIDYTVYETVLGALSLDWNMTDNHDTQLARALEIVHE